MVALESGLVPVRVYSSPGGNARQSRRSSFYIQWLAETPGSATGLESGFASAVLY